MPFSIILVARTKQRSQSLSPLSQRVAFDRIGRYVTITNPAPSVAQKEQALREVLESQAFSRSEQLKNFLRYVCELEIAGRGAEIKEYSIGTDALGRPTTYSTVNDSSVRRRAFELRAKLDELYQSELLTRPLLIDLPKGSYVPVFRFRGEPTPAAPAPARTSRSASWFAGVLAGVLAAGLLLGTLGTRWMLISNSGSAIVREAWGPLATQGNVLICLATPFHLVVRPGEFSPDADLPAFPAPAGIEAFFEKTNPRPAGTKLFMRPTLNTTTLGALGAVAAAATSLQSLGIQVQILPERTAPLASFRNRNVILVGDPLISFAAAQLLRRARLTIVHDPATNRLVIRDQTKPPQDPPAFARQSAQSGNITEVYGLLTVLPTDAAPGQNRRTLIVSGVSNVGVQGAMEFFTSPERLQELKARFLKDGLPGFPRSYQLVVHCTAQDSLPLSCGYAAHYVLAR